MVSWAMGTFCDMKVESLKHACCTRFAPLKPKFDTQRAHHEIRKQAFWSTLNLQPHTNPQTWSVLNLKCQMQARGGSASIEFGKLWGRKSPSSLSQKLQNSPVSSPKSLPYSGDPRQASSGIWPNIWHQLLFNNPNNNTKLFRFPGCCFPIWTLSWFNNPRGISRFPNQSMRLKSKTRTLGWASVVSWETCGSMQTTKI